MKLSTYIEDIFENFYKVSVIHSVPMLAQDVTATQSFIDIILAGNPLTENQRKYILKILNKYKTFATLYNLDYSKELANPMWKTPTRVLDYSKRVWVEIGTDKTVLVHLKFPFQLKEEFDSKIEVHQQHRSTWDHVNKHRTLNIYDTNMMLLNEFVLEHNFEIDESFADALAQCEEIWEQGELITPRAKIVNDKVVLINAPDDAVNWWNQNSHNNVEADLMLAKSMGYLYVDTPSTTVQHIAASPTNNFWISDYNKFLELANIVSGKIAIVLDRSSDYKEWIKDFVTKTDNFGIDRNAIKVCFREEKEFNEWIKDNKLGGTVETGKFLIFQHKPAKWLFKDKNSVTLLVTNNLYPPTSSMTKDWMESHPCVLYVGDIRPSKVRKKEIVEL